MHSLNSIFSGSVPPGVYHLNSRARPAAIFSRAAAHGWLGFFLDGSHITDKASFLQACAEAMHFPPYFGQNWDAFEDSLTDLAWAPAAGYLLLYDHVSRFAATHPGEWQTALDILFDAVPYWQSNGIPFYVLLRGAGGLTRTLHKT
jgi:hypothetical protein